MWAMVTSNFSVAWSFDSGASPDGRWQSSPIVSASGAVFFATCDSAIHAVNGSTGAPLWSYMTDDVPRGSGALGSDGRLFYGANSGIVALDSATGGVLWNASLVAEGAGPIPSYVSPAVGAGSVVFMATCLDELFALDGETGRVLWSADLGAPDCAITHHSSPSTGRGGLVAIGSNAQVVFAFDGPTGRLRWQRSVLSAVWGSPLIDAAGTVFIVVTGGQLLGLDGDTGMLRWDFPFPKPDPSLLGIPALGRHPVSGDPALYIGDGIGRSLVAISAGCTSAEFPCWCSAGAQPNGTGGCAPCPLGEFGAIPGQVPCERCAAGSFSASEGATSCEACPPGSFAASAGLASCKLCEAGTFSKASGSTNCTACPAGQSSGPGAQACSQVAPPPAQSKLGLGEFVGAVTGLGAALIGAATIL